MKDPTANKLKKELERVYWTHFWGHRHKVTPRFCPTILGDGKRLICVMPIDSRPNHYYIRVDSKWQESNFAKGETISDNIGDIYDAIEDYFGSARYDDDSPQRKWPRPWPAADFSTGSSWSFDRMLT